MEMKTFSIFKEIKRYFLMGMITVLVVSCGKGVDAPDVSHISVDVNIKPFYQDLFALDVAELPSQFPQLEDKYGSFIDAYSQKVIQIGDPKDPKYLEYLKSFLEYDANKDVLEKCNAVFKDTQHLQEELSQAFRYLKYYFPEQKIPDIYLHISGFNQSIVADSAWLSISVEKYLGSDCEFYEWLSTPVYLRHKMTPEKIVPDVIKAIALTDFPGKMQNEDVISRMIHEGKLLYFIKSMMPDIQDSLLFDYNEMQLTWCQNSEAGLWAGMVERKHLYNSERMVIQKYVGDGPFSYYFGQESPGRAAVFLGYHIVEAYMKEHPELTLFQLMHEMDAHKILRLSRYRP